MSTSKCRRCFVPVETWAQWFQEECPANPVNGHDLPWPHIMELPGWIITSPSKLLRNEKDGLT